MITVRFYTDNDKKLWNDFVDASKNATFMINRNYLDYHKDRYVDFSLLFFDDEKLICLMPGSLHGKEVRAHGGLTYGGLIYNNKMTAQKMLDLFTVLEEFFKEKKIEKLIYKRVPSIYYQYPNDEDIYALFRNNATLVRRDISTCIDLNCKIKFSDLRKRGVKKAIKAGLEVRQSAEFNTYIDLLNSVLSQHHETKAVHTAEEIEKLALLFPHNIKLYSAFSADKMLSGVLIFETLTTVHAQYIANSDEGRDVGALDLVMDYLINTYSNGKKYFDFGISTEDEGRYLNTGLVSQKEGFGGRAICYDFYEWRI